MIKKIPSSKGFTLVETMVAISIIVLAVAGPLAVSSKNISAGIFARNQIVASLLAQEGMEIVRNIRDRDQLASNSWLAAFIAKDCVGAGKACVIDAGSLGSTNPELESCVPADACNPLKLVSLGSGVFGSYYDQPTNANGVPNGANSIFTRKVTILRPTVEFDTGNKEAIARVTVTWQSVGTSKSLTLEEELFKFYDATQ